MSFSKDAIVTQFREDLSKAFESQDTDQLVELFSKFATETAAAIEKDYKAYVETNDSSILMKRGIRTLTSKEKKFYEAAIKAIKTGSIEKSFEGIENAFPETVIDATLEDIKTEFPLLSAINFQNTSTITKIVVNKKGIQLAVWGALGSEITKELEGAIGKVDVTLNKLTAYLIISKDMLDAGPQWLDAYVRAILKEALSAGLCQGIITGTGKDQPIGMDRDVSETAAVVGGVYPKKAAMAITDFSPVTIGTIAAKIAKGPNDRSRVVPKLLLIVNPIDYFSKVMPATTYLTPQGGYVNNIMPYPTEIIQDTNVTEGQAIFGLAPRYFMGVGVGGSGGKIEFDDSVRFFEDERAYLTKLYGNGMPLDNNAFILCDISGLKPLEYAFVNMVNVPVETTDPEETPEG